MYPVSADFKRAVRGSHVSTVRCEVWNGESKILDLEPLSGQIDIDSRRSVRRTLSLEVAAPRPTTAQVRTAATYQSVANDYATYSLLQSSLSTYGALIYQGDLETIEVDPGLVPDDAFDALAPFGNEIRVWRGVRVERQDRIDYQDITGFTVPDTFRTNLIQNPSLETNTTGWGTVGASAAVRSTAQAFIGTASYLVTANATGVVGPFITALGSRIAITGSVAYTASIYVRDINTAQQYRVGIEFYNAISGGSLVGSFFGTATSINASGWTRLSLTSTAPATAVAAVVTCYSTGTPTNGTQVYFDGALFEQSSVAGNYFDGSTDPRASWSGTAHANTSTLNTGFRLNPTLNPAVTTNTTGWIMNASASPGTITRITGLSGIGTTALTTAFEVNSAAVARSWNFIMGDILNPQTNFAIGRTYTLSFFARVISGPTTGFAAWFSNGPSLGNPASPWSFTPSTSWQRFTFTFTATGQTLSDVDWHIDIPTSVASVTQWTGFLIEEANTAQEYFDGNNGGGSWSGTVGGSASTTRANQTGTYYTLQQTYPTYGVLGLSETTTLVDEEVPLGVFLITDVDIRDGANGIQISIQGSDRSLRVARARWTNAYQIASATNAATAIADLLGSRYDDVQTAFTATTATVAKATLGVENENDPWRDALKLAEAAGLELFFNGDGIAVLQPARDYEIASPDAVYRENEEAMVLSLSRRLSNEQTYNGVIVTAEGSDTTDTFRAEAWDDDPASPTYRFGKFGQVPYFFSSPLINSQDSAQSAAETRLSKIKGAVESVDWSQIVDPSLDAGDVIAVTNSGTKVDRLMVLDRLSVPLGPSQAMTAVARTIRSLNGETFLEETS